MSAHPPSVSSWPRLGARIGLVLGLAALAVPFLKFAHNTSPLDTLSELFRKDVEVDAANWQFAGLGAPMFFGWPIFGLRAFRSLRQSLGPATTRTAWGLAAVAAAFDGQLVIGLFLMPGWDWAIALIALVPVLAWAMGAALLRRRWTHLVESDLDAVMALEIAFIAHALLLLVALFDSRYLGWWLTATAVLGFSADIVGSTLGRVAPRPRAFPQPVAP